MDNISFTPLITLGMTLFKFSGTLSALGVLFYLWKVLCDTYLGIRYRLPPDGPRTALYSPIFGRMPEMNRSIATFEFNMYWTWLLGVNPRPACLRNHQKDNKLSSDENYKGDLIKDYEKEGGRCVMITFMGKKLIFVKDPALAKRMLDDIKTFPTRDHSGKIYLGPGLNSFDAPVCKQWKVHRSVLMQSMSPKNLHQYSEEMGQVGLEICRMLQPSHVKSFLQDLKTDKQSSHSHSQSDHENESNIADLVHQYLGDGEKEFLPQSLDNDGKDTCTVHIRDGMTLMKRATFAVLCRTVLGRDWNKEFAAHVSEAQKAGPRLDIGRLMEDQQNQLRFANSIFLFPRWMLPFMKYVRSDTKPAMESYERTREVLLNIVRRLRQEYGVSSSSSLKEGSENNAKVPPATIAATLALHEENLDEEDVISELFLLMVAGHETTANTLVFTLCCLGRDPQCRRVCFEHACSVLGGASASPEHIYKAYREGRLFWMHAVLREACRLFPIIQGLGRVPPVHVHGFDSAADRKEKNSGTGGGEGFTIPAGSICIFSGWAAGRSEEYFGPDVKEFRPERWLTAEETAEVGLPVHPHPVPSEYRSMFDMGFGGGQRKCPGKRFAEEEAVMLLTYLTLAFDFTLTAVDGSAEKLPKVVADLESHSPDLINHPRYPTSFAFTPRKVEHQRERTCEKRATAINKNKHQQKK